MTTLQHEFEEKVVAENIAFETYLREFDGQHAEFYDGKVILMSPASGKHNRIVRFLIAVFDTYLNATQEGDFRHETVTMRLLIDGKVRGPEPDLFVVCTANLEKLTPTYMNDAADLVVEVISAESEHRDRGDKFIMYEKAGVQEYWLIDSIRNQSYFYVLDSNHHYALKLPDEHGVYHSVVLPQLYFEVSLLQQEHPPSVADNVELVKAMLKQG